MKPRQAPSRQTAQPLQQYLDQPFRTSDHVLLYSFGLDLAAERTTKQLRRALLAAGFPGPATGYLIRNSPLLQHSSRRCYRLQAAGESVNSVRP